MPPSPQSLDPAPSLALDQQLCFALYAATNVMTRTYRRGLAVLGLTYPQYLVMLVLWERDGIGMKDVADALDLDAATITPLVKRLEVAGWVRRQRSPRDERVVQVFLTPHAREQQARAAEVQRGVVCSTGLDGAGFTNLKQALHSLAGTMREQLEDA
jgi:MarR family transcriptional regulator, organic hydroperoxide resistance regulator